MNLKKLNPVNFYKTDDDEIITACADCAPADSEYVDLAGEWDICGFCGDQNIAVSFEDLMTFSE